MSKDNEQESKTVPTTFQNPLYLRTEQYRDASNLDARAALHARYSINPVDWHTWLFGQIRFATWCRVLEIGCGHADLWRKNAGRIDPASNITLTDLSAGMVQCARGACQSAELPARFAAADVQALPFPDAHYDVVVANHMLYHVPDLDRAFSEIRRVLRPNGRLYAATNGANHMHELRKWSKRFALGLTHGVVPRTRGFDLESGGHRLEPWFDNVVLERYEDELCVTEVEPLIDYIQSTQAGKHLSADQAERSRAFFQHIIETEGAVRITKDSGLFRAVRREDWETPS